MENIPEKLKNIIVKYGPTVAGVLSASAVAFAIGYDIIKGPINRVIDHQLDNAIKVGNLELRVQEEKTNRDKAEIDKEIEEAEKKGLSATNKIHRQTAPKQEKHNIPNGIKNLGLEKALAYKSIVEKLVNHYNDKFDFPEPLETNYIYSMISTEAIKGRAFEKDPMQIANQGDHALRALANGEEYTWQIGDFSFLKGIKATKIKHWKRTYDSNMTPEKSLHGGIAWLINKAAIRDNNGNIVGWRAWNHAVHKYNGGGTPSYAKKVESRKQKYRIINNQLATTDYFK